jgi:hypothetical protein
VTPYELGKDVATGLQGARWREPGISINHLWIAGLRLRRIPE